MLLTRVGGILYRIEKFEIINKDCCLAGRAGSGCTQRAV